MQYEVNIQHAINENLSLIVERLGMKPVRVKKVDIPLVIDDALAMLGEQSIEDDENG